MVCSMPETLLSRAPTERTPNPFAAASLPPAREWLTSVGLAKDGLYLSSILATPRLFISDVASAGSPTLLTQHGIGAILSLVPQPFERMTVSASSSSDLERYRVTQSNQAPYKDPNLARYYISLSDDGTNSASQLIAAFKLLQDICRAHRDTGILVHCQAGLSRSVSLVAALIAKSQSWSFQEAVEYVADYRQVGIHEDLAITLANALRIKLDREVA